MREGAGYFEPAPMNLQLYRRPLEPGAVAGRIAAPGMPRVPMAAPIGRNCMAGVGVGG